MGPWQVMASARVRSPPATAQALEIAGFGTTDLPTVFGTGLVARRILRCYLTWLEALSLPENRVPQEETMVHHPSFGAPPMFGPYWVESSQCTGQPSS